MRHNSQTLQSTCANNFQIRLVFDKCEIYQLRFIVLAFFISLAYIFCTSYNISESSFHGFMLFTFVQHYMPLKTTVTEDMNEQCNELHVLDVT